LELAVDDALEIGEPIIPLLALLDKVDDIVRASK